MSTIDPTLDALSQAVIDLRSRVYSLESARQPYIGDWYDFNPQSVSYTSATRVTFADIEQLALVQIGDKIRIDQSGYKYFWVINKGATYIDIDGGDNYTFTNTTISGFSSSRISAPLGWPSFQQFVKNNIDVQLSGAAPVVNTWFRRRVYFSMVGSQVRADFSILVRLTSGRYQTARLALPIKGVNALNTVGVVPGPGNGAYTATDLIEPIYPYVETTGSFKWPDYVAVQVYNNQIGQGSAPGQDSAFDISVFYDVLGG